jgi:dipeptidyl aminopeptidase/acylaminoacyl peptidase
MRSTMKWVALGGFLALAGCQSGKNVTIVTTPDQAEVVAGGSPVGVTPYLVKRVKFDRGFELRKENYQTQSITINSSSPSTVLVPLSPKAPEPAVKATPKTPETAGKSIPEVTMGAQGPEVQRIPVYSEEDVIERSPNVKSVGRLTDLANTRWLGAFCLSPDDRTAVMEVLDEEQAEGGAKRQYSNLWAVNTTGGGGMQRVTQGRCFDSAPSFSPDGQFVYFSSSRVGKNSIWKIAANGVGGLGLVTSFTTADTCPQVSPDGTLLTFTAHMAGSRIPQVWTTPLGPGLPNQLREGEDCQWSPDGKTLLFTSRDRSSGKPKIWTMALDGSTPVQLTHAGDCSDIHPRWSPDGKEIVFASDRGQLAGIANFDIWIMNADGSNARQLTTNGSRDDYPTFSHDGKTIYFRSNRGLKWDIWAMELVGASYARSKAL